MGKSYLRNVVSGILLTTAGTVVAEDRPIANETAKRIVILGDSITAGYGLPPNQAYPALIQEKITQAGLPHTVVNAGVSGDTTAGGVRRVSWALAKGADILIIALGGNDGLRGVSPEETKKNLLQIAHTASTKNPDIQLLIAGMQMPDTMGKSFATRFRAIFPEAAEEAQATLIPYLLEGVGGIQKYNQPDRIHPTAKGQTLVAQNVWKTLKQTLTKNP